MLKTISGLSPCSSGGGGGGTADNISGGGAGNVLYQLAPSDTGFTNSAAGVLQSNGSTPSFSLLNLSGPYVTGVVPFDCKTPSAAFVNTVVLGAA